MPYILVVDDDIDFRGIMVLALQAADFQVVGATNGLEALNFICDPKRDTNPYLILLDLYMPVMNGQQFLNVLKACTNMSQIQVVVITGSDSVVNGYRTLTKPVAWEELIQVAGKARSFTL